MMEDDEGVTIQSPKTPNFLAPKVEEIKQVTLLSELKFDEMSPVERVISPISETVKIELNPLSFTVDKNFFDLTYQGYNQQSRKTVENVNQFIQNRGFLQLENKYRQGIWDLERGEIDFDFSVAEHINLQFPTNKGFATNSKRDTHYYRETDKTAKTHIYFRDIESISFNKGVFKSKLIFKLKPERKPHRLIIDQVEREVVLNIARKDNELAKQFVSAILMEISGLKDETILPENFKFFN